MMLRSLRNAARGVWYALVMYYCPPTPQRHAARPAGWEWRDGFLLTSLYDPAGHVRGCVFPMLDREPPGWACWSVYPADKATLDRVRLPAPLHSGTIRGTNQIGALRSAKTAVEQALARAGW